MAATPADNHDPSMMDPIVVTAPKPKPTPAPTYVWPPVALTPQPSPQPVGEITPPTRPINLAVLNNAQLWNLRETQRISEQQYQEELERRIDRYLAADDVSSPTSELLGGVGEAVKALPASVVELALMSADGYRYLYHAITLSNDPPPIPWSAMTQGVIDGKITLDSLGRDLVHTSPVGILFDAGEGKWREAGRNLASTVIPVAGAQLSTSSIHAFRQSLVDASLARAEMAALDKIRVEANILRDGSSPNALPNPKVADEFYQHAARTATINSGSQEVILGPYMKDSAKSYERIALQRQATFFNLPEWAQIESQLSKEQIWQVNEAFLDQQIAQGKTFAFTSDPRLADPRSYTGLEYDYFKTRGYELTERDGLFYATKN